VPHLAAGVAPNSPVWVELIGEARVGTPNDVVSPPWRLVFRNDGRTVVVVALVDGRRNSTTCSSNQCRRHATLDDAHHPQRHHAGHVFALAK